MYEKENQREEVKDDIVKDYDSVVREVAFYLLYLE